MVTAFSCLLAIHYANLLHVLINEEITNKSVSV